MNPFRKAVEDGDHAAVVDLLAEDVVFTSPVVFKPYAGKPITAAILGAVIEVFEDFHYIREIANPDGRDLVLVFEARVGDRALQGCDILHFDEDGRVDEPHRHGPPAVGGPGTPGGDGGPVRGRREAGVGRVLTSLGLA